MINAGKIFLKQKLGIPDHIIEILSTKEQFFDVYRLELQILNSLFKVMINKLKFSKLEVSQVKIKSGSTKNKLSMHLLFSNIIIKDLISHKHIASDIATTLHDEIMNECNSRQNNPMINTTVDL
eukprot:GHVR01086307.1.p2 GENE.GHVR01086307.1~~GHVR01086307.1.p2  ORF type:complete len:124 (-),score=11.73 GHVR01086307.1:76-447(-)